ncbi:DNA-methyltransferase [Mycolicibacterium fortuitum]|uniref:DNA-methyltransferase n=1 Tax=Mycolicibacterium fortuitum TaxID=1766 RepID=UPI00260E3B3C|nr:site-specific DNA-methyltransferase [Mycolicibacterium fortuitum]
MTTPYYQDDLITLYHGSCLDVTEWLDADVLITDPPYGMSFRSNQRTATEKFDAIAGDNDPGLRDEVLERWRSDPKTLKANARAWSNGDGMPGPRPAAMFGTWSVTRPNHVTNLLVWNKTGAGPGMGDVGAAFGRSHEEIYLIGRWPKPEHFRRRGSVISTDPSPSALTSKIGHPTPKPVGLMEVLVDATPPGAVIAEPFAGSGATLLAARNLGRRVIGVELEEKYCELIANRLDQFTFGGI